MNEAVRRSNAEIRNAGPGWIEELVGRFGDRWRAFSTASSRLPTDLHDLAQLSGERFDAYRDAQDAGHALTQLLTGRVAIGSLFGDSGDLESQFAMVVDVRPESVVRWPDVMAAVRAWQSQRDSVLKWRALPLSIGSVRLAGLGQVPGRVAALAELREQAFARAGSAR
jgi:hypothetical protein